MSTARYLAAMAIAEAAEFFPNQAIIAPTFQEVDDVRERHLALSIYRTTQQHWFTLTFMLDRHLRQPCIKLEPKLQGIFLTATSQLLFFSRMPTYAIVNEAVTLAKKNIRAKAGGLVNAVLRKILADIGERETLDTCPLAADCLPLEQGSLKLTDDILPDPKKDLPAYLSIAYNQQRYFIQALLKQFSQKQTLSICQYAIATPPTIVAVEPSWQPDEHTDLAYMPHAWQGFIIWQDSFEKLQAFLAANHQRRVQDPASSLAVEITKGLALKTIVDLCAGRGTKTKQLAQQHPLAAIYATDVDRERFTDLRKVAAAWPNIHPFVPGNLPEQSDLVLLDVPCSNSAVLARRPEARYRLNHANTKELIELQRSIIAQSMATLGPSCYLLYSTCSLLENENQQQTQWILKKYHATLLAEKQTLPEASPNQWHDGSYHALLQLNATNT